MSSDDDRAPDQKSSKPQGMPFEKRYHDASELGITAEELATLIRSGEVKDGKIIAEDIVVARKTSYDAYLKKEEEK